MVTMISNLFGSLMWMVRWMLIGPMYLLVGVLMAIWFIIALIQCVFKRSTKPLYTWRLLVLRKIQGIKVIRMLETIQMKDIIADRDRHLDKHDDVAWDNNDSVQYYAEVIKIMADGLPEKNHNGYVLHNYRVYAHHQDFHRVRQPSRWNMIGMRKSLESMGYLVNALYYRVGQDKFRKCEYRKVG